MTDLWPWLVLVGLGAFHGVNPAMGWLFAVALGLHRRSRAVVLQSLIPIALGHSLAVVLVALAVVALGTVIDHAAVRVGAGAVLIGWAVYHWLYGSRHRVRVGMRTGLAGLALWSFLMASAHGAGLMLLPVLVALGRGESPTGRLESATAGHLESGTGHVESGTGHQESATSHPQSGAGALESATSHVEPGSHHPIVSGSLPTSLAAVGVHTLALLVVTGAIAVAVYEWVGLAFLRRAWINLDLLWTGALVVTGLVVILTASH
jgi:hypothetical protein